MKYYELLEARNGRCVSWCYFKTEKDMIKASSEERLMEAIDTNYEMYCLNEHGFIDHDRKYLVGKISPIKYYFDFYFKD